MTKAGVRMLVASRTYQSKTGHMGLPNWPRDVKVIWELNSDLGKLLDISMLIYVPKNV